MAKTAGLEFGMWWKYGRYRSDNNQIVPVIESKIQIYPLSEDILANYRTRQRIVPPYLSLIKLARNYRPGEEIKNKDEILNWCSEWGLLGILPHTLEKIVFSGGFKREERKLHIKIRRIERTNAKWQERYSNIDASLYEQKIDNDNNYDRKASATILSLRERKRQEVGLKELSGYFPPSAPECFLSLDSFNIATQMPSPSAQLFREKYREPFKDFLEAAQFLRRALQNATQYSLDNKQARSIDVLRNDALRDLEALAEPQVMRTRFEKGSYVRKKMPISLLAALAECAINDLLIGRYPRSCECCEELFVSTSGKARYCSKRCADILNKRNQRNRDRQR